MKNTITYARTLEVLRNHGLKPDTDTEARNGKLMVNTSFFNYFGIKTSYIYRDVLEWLGY